MVEGQIRVVLLALEQRFGRQISPEEAIVSFIPEYAAHVLNRLEVGKDGKTANERARGKRATVWGGVRRESAVDEAEGGQGG